MPQKLLLSGAFFITQKLLSALNLDGLGWGPLKGGDRFQAYQAFVLCIAYVLENISRASNLT